MFRICLIHTRTDWQVDRFPNHVLDLVTYLERMLKEIRDHCVSAETYKNYRIQKTYAFVPSEMSDIKLGRCLSELTDEYNFHDAMQEFWNI